MKTPMMAVGTAVFGIAIGYLAGHATGTSGTRQQDQDEGPVRTSSTRRSEAAQGASARKTDAIAAGLIKGREANKMTAAEAMEMVKANNIFAWNDDPLEAARKSYEFQLMLSKLPISVLEDVIKLSQESGIPSYRTRQIFSAYAARDLEKATAWAAGQPNPDSWKGAIINAIAVQDPGRATEMFQDGILKSGYSGYGGPMNEASYSLATSYAKQGKTALLQFIDSLPSNAVSNMLSNSIRSLPKEDLPGMLDEIAKRAKDGKVEQWTVSNILQNLANTDSAMARSWVDKMEPGQEQTRLQWSLAGTLNQQGKSDEAIELAKASLAQQAGKEKEFFINQAGNLMYNNAEFAIKVAELLPPGSEMTKDDAIKLSERSGQSDMINISKLIKSPDDQVAYLEDAIGKMGNRGKLNEADFRVLSHRLASLPLTADGASRVNEVLAASREKALRGN